jgi:hypothetical protein
MPLLFAAAMIGWHEYALRKNWIRPLMKPEGFVEDAARPEGMNGRAGKNGAAELKKQMPSEEK